MNHPFGIVYQIRCLRSGKSYIGVTTKSAQRRFGQHLTLAFGRSRASQTALSAAIRHHGTDSFEIQELASAPCVADLYELERLLISQKGTLVPFGYNITQGGEGFCGITPEIIKANADARRDNPRVKAARRGKKHSAETKEKISKAGRGRPKSASHKGKISTALAGRQFSTEHRMNLSAKAKSRDPLTDQERKALSDRLRAAQGPYSDERRAKLAANALRRWMELRATDPTALFAPKGEGGRFVKSEGDSPHSSTTPEAHPSTPSTNGS